MTNQNFDWQTLGQLQIAIVVTGGGTGVIGDCFGRSGASTNFVHAAVPYSRGSLAELIGGAPRQCVSAVVAAEMAKAAYRLADRWSDRPATPRLGIAMTACLPTQTPGRAVGSEVFLAAKNDREILQSHCCLNEDDRDQAERQTAAAFFELLRRAI